MLLFVAETVDLSEFVRKVLTEKNLSTYDVQRNSKGRIAAATVTKIINREIGKNTIDTLVALAAGIGEPEEKVLRVARGLPPDPPHDRSEILAEAFDGRDLSESDWAEIEAVLQLMVNQKRAVKEIVPKMKRPPVSGFKRRVNGKG